MSEDLVSIRMMCVAVTPADHDLWRQGAGRASVPRGFDAPEPSAAPARLARGNVDICIVDVQVPEVQRIKVIKAARAVQPTPFVVASAPRGAALVEGVDGMVPRPSSPAEARRAVELCVRVKIPTRVLIVDDSGTMRSIVRKILSASRFALDIHEASEGINAVNQLRGGNFGLVFLDYNMPGLNGFETLSEIKRESPDVAVVMMTSTLDNAIADRAHAAGAHAFLKKPFYPADIDTVLVRYFGMYAGRH
jgi:DNA-binding NarL/FixJ family response regulator